MADETQNVPRYFADFVKQNADEHGRLAAEIAATRGDLTAKIEGSISQLRQEIATNRIEIARAETRSTRWMIGTIIGATTLIITAMTIIVG